MNILYDYQVMLSQKYGGVSRGFCEVASRLNKYYSENVDIVADGSKNYYLEELMGVKAVSEDDLKDKNRMQQYEKDNQEQVIERCKQGKCDILHSTWYHPYLYKVSGCKHIITVHDMIQEIYPLYFAPKDLVECKRRLIEEADMVIAVSNHTKKDIISVYPHISDKKVQVVYQGGRMECNNVLKSMNIPQNYLLYVGVRSGYKNFDTFYIAAESLMKKHRDLYLICVGGGEFTPFEKRLMTEMKERVLHINATEAQLKYLYSHAMEFVFPSKYEGFGIPIVEAFSCGCPVVLSDASCFGEIAQDAAIYFNPDSVADMEDKMEKIMLDRQLRKCNINKGRKRSDDFSWENSTKQMHKAYRKALEM